MTDIENGARREHDESAPSAAGRGGEAGMQGRGAPCGAQGPSGRASGKEAGPAWRIAPDGAVLRCRGAEKVYGSGALRVAALNGVDFEIRPGQSACVLGASGTGKSTLMHILGGLDKPTAGTVELMGQDLSKLGEKKLSALRNQALGFVYQFHHLLREFSALENVMMPLLVAQTPRAQAEAKAKAMLRKVGLEARCGHRPGELSGGERQRAAIARALANDPLCVLADEPTGNLDRANAKQVFDLMLHLRREFGTALVVVTHDEASAERFDRVYRMVDGKLEPQ